MTPARPLFGRESGSNWLRIGFVSTEFLAQIRQKLGSFCNFLCVADLPFARPSVEETCEGHDT
ncbi:MAG: hypothetical protein ACREFD_11005, partial [Stellaceae bacterium]